ncbi:DUF968 domain-containing protein [Novosphingobium sp. Leaf2]|uniref:DUF968 domain-containing protein n=1 Tax=Novosphingobium sp. Leaf2 TaxID=1735670 RepID=UPI0009EBB569|nr:putative HNHc nuclease [Novosphingobium sp. Leaf2]
MALPRRIPKERNRSERRRSQAHCTFVRSHQCCVPGCQDMPIEVAHVRAGSDAGMGRKPSDWFTVSLCRGHHSEQHRIGEGPFGRVHGIDLHTLAAEFAAASPKAAEIRLQQRGRAR